MLDQCLRTKLAPQLRLAVILAALCCLSNVVEAARIPPTDPNIYYTGRWDFTNPVRPMCGWQGTGFIINFEGTAVRAALDSGSVTEYFRVIVDDDHTNTQKIAVAPGRAMYTLISGLTSGVHKLELVKETYLGTSATFFGLRVLGNGLVAPPPPVKRRIEFYGDSNLAGVSLEHEENAQANALVGTVFGYAGITARMFDAEYHNISVSGATISSLHGQFDRIDWWSPNPPWDFANFPADAVVVNLGANDVGSPGQQIRDDYHAFLDELRDLHPDAHIMLFNAWGWDYNEPANYIHAVIAERSDPNMSSAVFPWLFEQWHGCEYDHAGMAAVLADHLSAVMGWTPNQSDVMSGFGVDDNVANGSFEQAAPFGGYGWRYMLDTGVKRLHHPAGAFSGEYYMQLIGGALMHQPNPALPDDLVTVSVWLRGKEDGDQATITIDFRDQQMFTTPLQSDSLTVTLSTQWQQFSFAATAPVGEPRPGHHTRFTIAGDPASTVWVDLVEMKLQDPT